MRRITALVLSTVSAAALSATPAFAQTASPAETTPEKTAEGEQLPPSSTPTDAEGQPTANAPGTIVVTGSRIRRDNYNQSQNVDILTRDDTVLAGSQSTVETLQSATIASGTAQIDGSFIGFLSAGGQGASNIGLRGLGPTRTLVLLNGRRLAPAGVGPELTAADLNTLPTGIVQRIEVLREGASSVYGSDAIAGVINVITDTELDGITLDAYASTPTDYGAGQTYRGSLTAGKTFSRGRILGAFEYREDKGLSFGDNEHLRCPRELAYIDGEEVGQLNPDGNGLRCFPFSRSGAGGTARGYGILASFNTGAQFRASYPGYITGEEDIFGLPVNVNNEDIRPLNSEIVLETTLFTPIRTYTGYLNGAYELGFLGDAELYGEGLFSRRKSNQTGTTQIAGSQALSGQFYGGDFFGTPLEEYGYAVSPFFPTAWAEAGYNRFFPFIAPNRTLGDKQKVDFWRANGGVRGALPFGDWRYDANVQFSRTKSRYDVQTELQSRFDDIFTAVLAPAGTPSEFITVAIPGQVGAGNSYTCAANVTNGAYNGGTCQPLNFYDPDVLNRGNLTDAQFDYLYANYFNYTKTKFKQETYAIGLDGSLFSLPGGEVKAAIGAEYRKDAIDDRPGAERAAGDLRIYGTAAQTKGSDNVKELYGELSLPIFKDRPGFQLLDLSVSGRYTDYKSYGSDFTYSANAQWAPIREVRFRANYGTQFRAPNLYEQFIADSIGFYSATIDPCEEFATNLDPSSVVYQNCLAVLTPILDDPATAENEALAYETFGGSIQVTTTGGAGVLEAETAKTYGFGVVLQAPRSFADFTMAIDYFNIDVNDQVSTLGNLILDFCYDSPGLTDPTCQFIGPRNPVDDVDPGEISNFQNPFLNIAEQRASGIDIDARFNARFLGGRFTTQLQATRNLHQQTRFFPGGNLNEYNGTLGYPGNGAGPKWVGSLDTRFTTGNDITFRWGTQYVGPSNSQELLADNPIVINGVLADYDLRAEPYFEHAASVQFLWRNMGQVSIGLRNVFDAKPPKISSTVENYTRVGNYFSGGDYDLRGRTFFVNVTRSFK